MCLDGQDAPVLNVELLEQVLDVGVGTKEDVQASLIPVAVLVLPGGNLSRRCELTGKAVASTSFSGSRPMLLLPRPPLCTLALIAIGRSHQRL
jgi:hypothetical protein